MHCQKSSRMLKPCGCPCWEPGQPEAIFSAEAETLDSSYYFESVTFIYSSHFSSIEPQSIYRSSWWAGMEERRSKGVRALPRSCSLVLGTLLSWMSSSSNAAVPISTGAVYSHGQERFANRLDAHIFSFLNYHTGLTGIMVIMAEIIDAL